MVKCRYLVAVFLLLSWSTASVAQKDSRELATKIDRIERQMRALQRKVFGSGGAVVAEPEASVPSASVSDRQVVADLSAKLGTVERQIRAMTGRFEELEFRQQQLNETIELLQRELAFQREEMTRVSQTGPVAAPTATPAVAPKVEAQPERQEIELPKGDASEQYKYAFSFIQKNDLESGRIAMEKFLAANSDEVLSGNAKFWIGRIHLRQAEYALAAKQLLELIEEHPNHGKRSDALVDLAEVLVALDSKPDACNALAEFRRGDAKAADRLKARADRVSKQAGCS